MVLLMRIASLFILASGVTAQFPCESGYKAKTGDPVCAGSTSQSCSAFYCCDWDTTGTTTTNTKCSSHTCTAGMKLNNNAADTTCLAGSCSDLQCCSIDETSCLNFVVATALACNIFSDNFVDTKKNGNTAGDSTEQVGNCCSAWSDAQCSDWSLTTVCASGTYYDPNKATYKVGDIRTNQNDGFRSKCCTAVATCEGFSGCDAGTQLIENPGNTNCASDAATCTKAQCCKNTPGTCRATTVFCPTSKVKGNWGSTAGDTPKDACCVDPLKCSDWVSDLDVDAAREVKVSMLVGVSFAGAVVTALM